VDTANRPASEAAVGRRHRLGEICLALFFSLTPSTIPDWRADPGVRSAAVLPVGEPVASLDSYGRR